MLSGNKNLKDNPSGQEKNLKDPERKPSASYGAGTQNMSITKMSYNKTHKLITALYMVTDIIDKEEPIRNKLRTLGAEIVSDMHCVDIGQNRSVIICTRIAETVSFLNIASAMNFISEMNCTILKKEFLELEISVREYSSTKHTWLEGFLNSNDAFLPPLSGEDKRRGFNSPHPDPLPTSPLSRGRGNSQGHLPAWAGTRLGVQKGSTLMKALSDRINAEARPRGDVFDVLKKQRRDDIINIIKIIGNGATIKDIKDKVKIAPEQASFLVSCSEKTLQRELVSMVRDGVLNKTGEKRWSRYFLKN